MFMTARPRIATSFYINTQNTVVNTRTMSFNKHTKLRSDITVYSVLPMTKYKATIVLNSTCRWFL